MSEDLKKKRQALEEELRTLRQRIVTVKTSLDALDDSNAGEIVAVPPELEDTFDAAKRYVADYFDGRWDDPRAARILVSGERYILIRASSMSIEFFDLVRSLYRDRGAPEAHSVARGFLFDVAHALGKADAAAFHDRMGVVDPMEKLSAGPVHFAYTGWALVDIHPESAPSPDEDYFLYYDHPNSFEADAWIKRGETPDFAVCVMNAGYSSGWCEQSYGVPLVSTEITCRAKGDEHCRFIMAPPSRIQAHLERMQAAGQVPTPVSETRLEVPEFFKRKRLEDELRRARDELESRVTERTAELELRNAELRAANERLADLHYAQEEFLAMISHELRTPLVTGLGYIELLLRGKLGPLAPEGETSMKVALRNLKRLAQLVDEILRYHQLSRRDRQSALVDTFDLARLCTECVDELIVRTQRPPESVTVDCEDGLPPALADADMIRQVVSNLLNNADRHAGRQAHITLRVRRAEATRAQVSVSDDGAGMSAEMVRRASDPFIRKPGRGRGLGLGLAIVRSLLADNESELTLQSEEGAGTTASFQLRLLATATGEHEAVGRRRPRQAARDRSTPETPRRHLLLVEDDADTRDFMSLALGRHGFEVLAVESGEEALAQLNSFPAEVLLVDLGLPGMNGLELVKQVKAQPQHVATPVFLFTARAEASIQRAAVAAGCVDTLVKPLPMQDLLRHLEGALPAR